MGFGLIVLVAGGLLLGKLGSSESQRPGERREVRKLLSRLEVRGINAGNADEFWEKHSAALDELEAQGLPVMVEMILRGRSEETGLARARRQIKQVFGLQDERCLPDDQLALLAFELLGPRAAPAIPFLTNAMNASQSPRSLFQALSAIGPQARPSMISLLRNERRGVRLLARFHLMSDLKDDPELRRQVSLAALEDPDPDIRTWALSLLDHSLTATRKEMDAFARCLVDSDGQVRLMVTQVVQSIVIRD